MNNIEWVVGDLYEDENEDLFKLIADLRTEENTLRNQKLIFLRMRDTRSQYAYLCFATAGGVLEGQASTIIKKHEPRPSKKNNKGEIENLLWSLVYKCYGSSMDEIINAVKTKQKILDLIEEDE